MGASLHTLNFDTVSEDTEGGMSPAGSAVLGNVLVEVFCNVGSVVHVGPVPDLGEHLGHGVGVRWGDFQG